MRRKREIEDRREWGDPKTLILSIVSTTLNLQTTQTLGVIAPRDKGSVGRAGENVLFSIYQTIGRESGGGGRG